MLQMYIVDPDRNSLILVCTACLDHRDLLQFILYYLVLLLIYKLYKGNIDEK